MKKLLVCCGTLCAAFLLLCGTALAAEPQIQVDASYSKTVTVELVAKGSDTAFAVSKTGGDVQAGQLYLVLIQQVGEKDTTATAAKPTKENVYFLDVAAAEAGQVKFDAYPKEMPDGNYVIYLSDYAASGAAKGAALVTVGGTGDGTGGGTGTDFILGDVDNNGKVTPNDAVCVLKMYVGADNDGKAWTEAQKNAADVDHNNKQTPNDATRILQRYVGSISDADWK